MKRRKQPQTGFALLLVMLLLAMAVILGLSYLAIASVKASSSGNYVSAARAKYLAESGIQHALWVLQNNPATLNNSQSAPLGPFYVDSTADCYTFYAVSDAVIPGRYTLTAHGSAGGLTQTSQATVLRWGGPVFNFNTAVQVQAAAGWLPTSLTVNGNLSINGALVNYADINGNVSATQTVLDPYHLISGSKTTLSSAATLPGFTKSDYENYSLFGAGHAAIQKQTNTFAANDPLANGGAVTTSNPGGVVWLKPASGSRVKLPDNFNFTGTLVVDGDLDLGGKNIQITAVDGFPAIVTDGKVVVSPNSSAVINGVVRAGGGVAGDTNGSSGSATTINGGLISGGSQGYDFYLSGAHVLNFKSDRCTLYDMHNPSANTYTVRVESWLK